MRVSQSTSSPVQGSDVSGAKKTDKSAAGKKPEAHKSTERASASGGANAEISSRAKEMATAKAAAADAPDVREDKIAALKARIASGKYNVDADAIADRMVDDHIRMSGIG